MKGINLDSNEEALTQIVELVSGISREKIRSKDRRSKISIPRSILGFMLRDEGCTTKRAGMLVGRHHASILKYTKDHERNVKYYQEYSKMYGDIKDEYATGFRGAKVIVMQKQINELQRAISLLSDSMQL